MYEQDVLKLITHHPPTEETEVGAIHLMSGGSMMYIDAVCDGIDDIPTVDEKTRVWMKQRLADEGLPTLVEELKELYHTREIEK